MSNAVCVCSSPVHGDLLGCGEVDLIWDRTAGNRDRVTANTRNTLTAYSHIWRRGRQGYVNCSSAKHEVLLVRLPKVILLYKIFLWKEVKYSELLHSQMHEQLCVCECVKGKFGVTVKISNQFELTQYLPASCFAFWVLTLVWAK